MMESVRKAKWLSSINLFITANVSRGINIAPKIFRKKLTYEKLWKISYTALHRNKNSGKVKHFSFFTSQNPHPCIKIFIQLSSSPDIVNGKSYFMTRYK
jgi:hypothetical protein